MNDHEYQYPKVTEITKYHPVERDPFIDEFERPLAVVIPLAKVAVAKVISLEEYKKKKAGH